MMLEEHDELTRYCPQLGGSVPFKYCRSMNRRLPCRRIVVCWGAAIDVVSFLQDNFTEEELQLGLEKDTRSRIQKIVALAEQAKKNGAT